MLYSIGYQNLKSTGDLIGILQTKKIDVLVDVRSKPFSRKPAFNKNALSKQLQLSGIPYVWLGDRLGGFKEIDEKSIEHIASFQIDQKVCLMCMEADPDRCHRKYDIAERLKKYQIEVEHILT
jgi:uncharacterized protein (DUF488 family)